MKILIHAIGASYGGGRRHLVEFLPALAALGSAHEYVVLAREGTLESFDLGDIQIREIPVSFSETGIKRLYFDQFILPSILREGEFDICVSLLNFGPAFCPTKHIIFQRNALYFDLDYLKKEPLYRQMRNRIRGWIAGMAVRRADLVVSPSYTMRNMLVAAFPKMPSNKFAVLYHGFTTNHVTRSQNQIEDSIEDTNKPLSIFYPSHFARHKGYEVLIRAASMLVKLEVDFEIVVTVSEDYWPAGFDWFRTTIEMPELEGRIVNLGSVPQSDMRDLYDKSDVIFFPSQCESFGFPMLEAMGAAKPLVVSDIPICLEICGTAADYFPCADSENAAIKLSELVDARVRRDRANRSSMRFAIRDWSWEAYAAQFDDLMITSCGHMPIHSEQDTDSTVHVGIDT
jgi:glycosyltransferase involved in cell wall biosynthesis